MMRLDFLLGLALGAAFWPWWIDPAMAPRWIAGGLIVALALSLRGPLPRPPLWLALPLLGFLVFVAASLLWSPSPPDGIFALWRWALVAAAFAWGWSARSALPLILGLALAVALQLPLVLAQHLGFAGVPQAFRPAGLFANKNLLAEAGAVALAGTLALTSRRDIAPALGATLIAFLAAILVLAASKGALLAAALAILIWLGPRRPSFAVLAALGLLAVAAMAWSPASLTTRVDMWRDTLAALTPFGHGAGSFWHVWPLVQTVGWDLDIYRFGLMPGHPHNDALGLLSDFGIGALLLLPLVPALWRGRHDGPAFLAVVAFLGCGATAFPLATPLALAGAFLAGHAVRAGWRGRAVAGGGRNAAGARPGGRQPVGPGAAARHGGGGASVPAADAGRCGAARRRGLSLRPFARGDLAPGGPGFLAQRTAAAGPSHPDPDPRRGPAPGAGNLAPVAGDRARLAGNALSGGATG